MIYKLNDLLGHAELGVCFTVAWTAVDRVERVEEASVERVHVFAVA